MSSPSQTPGRAAGGGSGGSGAPVDGRGHLGEVFELNEYNTYVYSGVAAKTLFCNLSAFLDRTDGALTEPEEVVMLHSLFRRRASWERGVWLPHCMMLHVGERGPAFAHQTLREAKDQSGSAPLRPCVLFGKLLARASDLICLGAPLLSSRSFKEAAAWFELVDRLRAPGLFEDFDEPDRRRLSGAAAEFQGVDPAWSIEKEERPFFNSTVLVVSLAHMVEFTVMTGAAEGRDTWSEKAGHFFCSVLGLDERGLSRMEEDVQRVPYFRRPPYELLFQRPRARAGGHSAPWDAAWDDDFVEGQGADADLEDPDDPELLVALREDGGALPVGSMSRLVGTPVNLFVLHRQLLRLISQQVAVLAVHLHHAFSRREDQARRMISDAPEAQKSSADKSWLQVRNQEKQDRHQVSPQRCRRRVRSASWNPQWDIDLVDDTFIFGRHSFFLHQGEARQRKRARRVAELARRLMPNDHNV